MQCHEGGSVGMVSVVVDYCVPSIILAITRLINSEKRIHIIYIQPQVVGLAKTWGFPPSKVSGSNFLNYQ